MVIDEREAQSIVNRLISILGKNINIIDKKGVIIASGDKKRIGSIHEAGKIAAEKKKEITVNNESIGIYKGCKTGVNIPVYYENEVECVVGITGKVEEVKGYALIVKELVELMVQEVERRKFEYLKGRALRSFARELLKEHDVEDINVIDSRAKVMNFDVNIERTVIKLDICGFTPIINSYEDESEVMIQNFKQQVDDRINLLLDNNEIAFNMHDDKFVIFKSIKTDILNFCIKLQNTLRNDFKIEVYMGIGCNCKGYMDYNKSYLMADKAIEIGKKINPEKRIYFAEDYKLHMLLESATRESKKDYMESFKDIFENYKENGEMLNTIKTYFECNMSIKETASKMYVHRNTILYRLNKFKEKYSIDIFDTVNCMKIYIVLILKHQTVENHNNSI